MNNNTAMTLKHYLQFTDLSADEYAYLFERAALIKKKFKSYEKYLEMQTAAGKYTEPPLPKVGETKTPIQPIPMPEAVDKLQKAYALFVERVPSSGRVPTNREAK